MSNLRFSHRRRRPRRSRCCRLRRIRRLRTVMIEREAPGGRQASARASKLSRLSCGPQRTPTCPRAGLPSHSIRRRNSLAARSRQRPHRRSLPHHRNGPRQQKSPATRCFSPWACSGEVSPFPAKSGLRAQASITVAAVTEAIACKGETVYVVGVQIRRPGCHPIFATMRKKLS